MKRRSFIKKTAVATVGIAGSSCLYGSIITNINANETINIGVIGDSISYGAWCSNAIEDLLPLYLQNITDIGDVTVTNYAVSGTNSAYWASGAGSSIDLSSHDLVLCMLGTNDLQGGVSVPTYIANMNTIDTRVSASSDIVYGIFPIFTQASVSGVTGVTTQNYAEHAKYTHGLKKFCIDNGRDFADIRRFIGANITYYGDNIHPTVEGQIPIMAAWAEGIARFMKNKTGYLQY